MRVLRLPRRMGALMLAYACLGIVSCDDPLGPDGGAVARLEVSPALLQTVVGENRTLAARVVAADGSILGDRRLFWSTQDPGVATVSQAGVVTAVGVGNTQVAVSSGGKSAVVPVTVAARPVTQVRIVPSTASVQAGRTTTLRADALDATGGLVAGKTVLWSSVTPAVATVTSTGVVTGVSAGTTTIGATVDGVSGTAIVTVTPIPVTSVAVSPRTGALIVGQTLQFSATTAAAGGQTLTDRAVTWTSSAAGIASVSSTGLVTAIAPGNATITATSEGVSGTATVTVAAVPVASVQVTPEVATVAAGQTLQLSAQALDSDGNILNRPITWSSELPARATVSATGLVTAIAAGEVHINARAGSVVAEAVITITQVPITRIDVTPANGSVLVGGTQQMTATPRDAAGNALAGRSITWLTGAPSVATISQTGLVTGVAAGSALVFAASEGQSGSATVNVTTVAVASVAVTPNTGNIQQGQALQLTATARDAGNNVITGRPIVWTSTDETKATVSSQGRVVTIAPGSVTIRATVDGVTGSGTYTITPVPVATVQVTPNTTTISTGGTQQLIVTLLDALGNPIATSGRTITWVSANPSIASVTQQGLVTGVASGSTSITITSEGVTTTASITVSPTPVASVTIAPANVSLNQGSTQSITATARDAGGNVLTGRAVTWSSSNVAVATVNTGTTAPTNTITAVAAGNATINAVVGGITGVATVSVTQVPIATITVTGSATVVEGGSITLTATALDASNNVLTGRTIVWSSSNAQVSVSQSGVVTAVINTAAQTATITASSPGGGAGGSTPSGTAGVTVSYAPVATVSSTPSASVSVGNPVGLAATLQSSGAQTLNAAGRTITWTSLDPGIGTVSTTGVVTGVSAGTARIEVTASSPGQVAPFPADTSLVTVGLIPVASVTVAPKSGPNPGTVHIGGPYARKFVATLRDAGNNILTGRGVVWSVSDGTKALITQDVDSTVVTGLTSGPVTLTATSEGVPGSLAITVDLVPVSSVSVTPSTATLNLATTPTQALAAAALDSAGSTISGAALGGRGTMWSSSAGAVATVNSSGLVTAVAAGSATITATVDLVPGTSSITVLPPVTAVALAVSPDSLILPGTIPGTVTVTGAGATPLSGRTVTVTSSQPAVATVTPASATSNGSGQVAFTITGVGAGSTIITATSEGISQTFTVRMMNPVASVTVAATPDSVIGTAGGTVAANATLRDAGNAVITGRPITWASSTPAVASVDSAGVITPLSVGTTSITATSETIVGSKTFRVLAPVNTISLTSPGDSIFGTGTLLVTPDLRDASNAVLTGRPVSWSSGTPSVATVNPTTGVVTGVSPGSSIITASSEGKTATLTVRVLASMTGITLSPATDSIIGMGTLALTATSTPALQGRAFTVTSSNTAVATVSPASGTTNATGDVALTVTYVGTGTTTLTVASPAEGLNVTRVLRMLPAVATVTLTSAGDSIIGTRTLATTVTTRDAANNVLTGRPVTYLSSNTAIATVSSTGVITGVAPGTVNITATSEGVTSANLAIRVLASVATVNVDFTPTTVQVGQTLQATATLLDALGNTLTGRPLGWSTNPGSKASISSSGLVSPSDSGLVNVIATVILESTTGSKQLTINLVPVSTVTLTPNPDTVAVAATRTITATVKDTNNANAVGRACTIVSGDTGKFTVGSGTATTNGSGQFTFIITGVATTGGTPVNVTATCEGVAGTSAITVP